LGSADCVSYQQQKNGIPHKSNEQFMFKSFIDFRGKDFLNYGIIKSHLALE
jgi:hypothetical protein